MNKNKINVYICRACRSAIVTINLEEGIIPFAIDCDKISCHGKHSIKVLDRIHEIEGMSCVSSNYENPQNLIPTHAWYRKSEMELKNEFEIDYQNNGGLFLRPLTRKEIKKYIDNGHYKKIDGRTNIKIEEKNSAILKKVKG